MNEIKEIEAKILLNKTTLKEAQLYVTIEEYIRYIECKTVTKIDINFCGTFYRIVGYKWYTTENSDFVFIFDSHKATIRGALEELIEKILEGDKK